MVNDIANVMLKDIDVISMQSPEIVVAFAGDFISLILLLMIVFNDSVVIVAHNCYILSLCFSTFNFLNFPAYLS